MNKNSISLLDRTVPFTQEVMRMLGGLLEREVIRDDPGWTAAMTWVMFSEKVQIKLSGLKRRQSFSRRLIKHRLKLSRYCASKKICPWSPTLKEEETQMDKTR